MGSVGQELIEVQEGWLVSALCHLRPQGWGWNPLKMHLPTWQVAFGWALS